METPAKMLRSGEAAFLFLAFFLPFEFTQKPLIQRSFITVTNLKLVFYVVLVWGMIGLVRQGTALIGQASMSARRHFVLTIVLLGALLVSSLISSLLSSQPKTSLKWTVDLFLGGIFWLSVPLWLRDERAFYRFAAALVAGACVAALVGVLEVMFGLRFADHLTWFKAKPTMVGTYVRLSGTFAYANIAAMYFELTLPFAAVGLAQSWQRSGHGLRTIAWATSLPVLLVALFLTFSRGALFGLGIGVAMMALSIRKVMPWRAIARRWRLVLMVGVGLVAVVGVVGASLPSIALLRLTTQSDQVWYRVSFDSVVPSNLTADAFAGIPVAIHNRGPLTWGAGGLHPYRLSYHWLFPSGKMALFEGVRTSLRTDLPPDGTRHVIATILTPSKPGRYFLVWDVVQEKVLWFSLKTAVYTRIPVQIHGPVSVAGAETPAGQPELPQASPQPDRGELWRVAVRMVRAHPLFGVGPDGYRLNYGYFTHPHLQQWDRRIFANSLPLEIFADLGLVGGLLFFGFLAVLCRPHLTVVYRGRVSTLWQVALVGAGAAFLGHGLVDYILGSHAIFILFWMIGGMGITLSTGVVPLVSGGIVGRSERGSVAASCY
jgi:O-Antigen ligase